MNRRSLLATLAAVVPFGPLRAFAAEPRAIYDVVASIDAPFYPFDCNTGNVRVEGGAAVVSLPCKTYKGYKKTKKGKPARMSAEVSFEESGEPVGVCTAEKRIKKPSSFTLTCSVPLPAQVPLPIAFSGNGPAPTAKQFVPSGTFIARIDAAVSPGTAFRATLYIDNGDSEYFGSFTSGPLSGFEETIDVYRSGQAYMQPDGDTDGAWSITLREAFPAS